jgi:hypothetical protein
MQTALILAALAATVAWAWEMVQIGRAIRAESEAVRVEWLQLYRIARAPEMEALERPRAEREARRRRRAQAAKARRK